MIAETNHPIRKKLGTQDLVTELTWGQKYRSQAKDQRLKIPLSRRKLRTPFLTTDFGW